MNSNKNLLNLLELANHYPSPHNGQPIRVKAVSDNSLEIYFDRGRGLQSTDISLIFSFVSVGVFIKHLEYAAQALGHKLISSPDLPKEKDLKGEGLVKVAECKINWNYSQPDDRLQTALLNRQTSRKKYYEDVSDETARELQALSASDMRLHRLSKDQTRQAIWLNQRAVFDDMFNESVRRELDHWLRYSQVEKEAKKDGLAYDCMELNGFIMKYIVNHPKILHLPGLSALLKRYYLRTMTDASSVFYLMAPFRTERQAYKVGETVMELWELVNERGYYLHPFGTIMSNEAAHEDFIVLAGEGHESRDNYLVFIFRCGKSHKPVPSLRLPVSQHLLME